MMQARIRISQTREFEGTFEAETLEEAVATAEMEARTKSEIKDARIMVLWTARKLISDEQFSDVRTYQGDTGQ